MKIEEILGLKYPYTIHKLCGNSRANGKWSLFQQQNSFRKLDPLLNSSIGQNANLSNKR
jgi:hypothetical protein